ncbi:unnamed protein product, partial [Discosporangium mesarthrocarpum]
DAEDWIHDIRYSPDGSRLGVASHDCSIYIYAVRDGYSKMNTVTMHQSFVTHLDFSVDGQYLQSCDGAGALLFADVSTGVAIPSESS